MLHVVNCVRCFREFQIIRNGKGPLALEQMSWVNYEESNFTTVVGNRDTFRHENERKMEIAIRTLI